MYHCVHILVMQTGYPAHARSALFCMNTCDASQAQFGPERVHKGGGGHMGSCLSEGIVSNEMPLKFRILLRGCPGWGYAWAYLLGGAIVGVSLQIHRITSDSWFTPCPNTTLVLHVSPKRSCISSIIQVTPPNPCQAGATSHKHRGWQQVQTLLPL